MKFKRVFYPEKHTKIRKIKQKIILHITKFLDSSIECIRLG